MKKRIYIIIGVVLALFAVSASAAGARAAETAVGLLQRSAAKLKAASSISANFTMKGGGQQWSGTFLSKGAKFSLTMPGAGTWYDGRDMWSYSKTSGEATVWHPSKDELAESNPFLYISTAANYDVKDAGTAKGVRTLLLTPKRRGSAVKSVKITISTATLLPKSFVINASSGSYTVSVSGMQLNKAVADANFRFNKAKYPGVTVTDLR